MRHISLELSEKELEVLQDALQQMREYESVRYAKCVQEDGQGEAVQSILERSKAMQKVQKQIADGGTGEQEPMLQTVVGLWMMMDIIAEGKDQLGKKRVSLQEERSSGEAEYYALCEELATKMIQNISDRVRASMRAENRRNEQ